MPQNQPQWTPFANIDGTTVTSVNAKDGMTVAVDQRLDLTGQVFRVTDMAAPRYRTVIKGQQLLLDTTGKVVEAAPGDIALNTQLKLLTWDIPQSHTVVTPQTRGGAGEGKATLSETTLRDQFAMNVLNAMIALSPSLKDADDAAMFSASNIAYRFAEAMMRTAANYRVNETEGSEENPDPATDIVGALNRLSTALTVKGNSTYQPASGDPITDVLKVNIVAGGGSEGSGGGSFDGKIQNATNGTTKIPLEVKLMEMTPMSELTDALGYAPEEEITQAALLAKLIAAVRTLGPLRRADISTIDDTQPSINAISDVIVFQEDFNVIHPYRATPEQLAQRLHATLKIINTTGIPTTALAQNAYYFIQRPSSTEVSSISRVDLLLPTIIQAPTHPIRIVVNLRTGAVTPSTGEATVIPYTITNNSGIPIRYRNTKPASLSPNTDYEFDLLYNATQWLVTIAPLLP